MAVTSGCAAAFRAISGPMPAGSPTVMPMRGLFIFARLTRSLARPTSPRPTRAAATRRPGGVAARAAAAFVAAAAVHDPLSVRELVAQAALQPAAHAGEPRRIEAQVLLL